MGRSDKLPEADRVAAPEYVVARIREILAKDPRVGEIELSIDLAETHVVVTGNVETDQQRDAISTILHELLPDRDVENHTVLTSRRETDHVERVD
ncbi:MAG TPA: BON domain-containing protein [Actinomycetota bacterium]|nr:BON domain-containing protein [Actinomycetota bacterium]